MHRVLSIPTVCVFIGGKEVKRLVGLRDKSELKQELDDLLANWVKRISREARENSEEFALVFTSEQEIQNCSGVGYTIIVYS